MKKNKGQRKNQGGGGGGGGQTTKSCPTCKYRIVRQYFKYHTCPLNKDGTVDVWESYDPNRARGRKSKRGAG